MAVSPDVLISPRLKVERAYRHIDELRSVTQPLSRDFYEIATNDHTFFPDFNKWGFSADYRPVKPIPELLALIIGDAVHNLRSALDHLATGICRSVRPGAKEHFPIHPKRQNLETAPALASIEEAIPGAKKTFLEKIRPQDGPDEALWRFNDLNNDDKHNLLIPTVTVAEVTGIDARNAGFEMANYVRVGDGARPLNILVVLNPVAPVTINYNATVAVNVSFGSGLAFENEPVVPTLTQIAGIVSHTIDEFETLINNST